MQSVGDLISSYWNQWQERHCLYDEVKCGHTLTVVLSEHLKTLKQALARWTLTSDRSIAKRTATLSTASSRSRQRGRATTPSPRDGEDHKPVQREVEAGETTSPTVWRLGRRVVRVELLEPTDWLVRLDTERFNGDRSVCDKHISYRYS